MLALSIFNLAAVILASCIGVSLVSLSNMRAAPIRRRRKD